MATFIARMLGAARLGSRTYEEVEADTRATSQALAVVLLASVGSGVGWIGASPQHLGAIGVLTATTVAGWVTWALLTYLIGTRLFPEKQTQARASSALWRLFRVLGQRSPEWSLSGRWQRWSSRCGRR